MKEGIVTGIGIAGGFIASAFGGFDAGMITLITFMAIDYFSGLIIAGYFHKSKKSENGSLESSAGFKGLVKKGMCLLIVLIGHQLDAFLAITFVRDAVIIGFVANELISIIENAGIMGVPIPNAIIQAIDLLNKKGGNESK